MKSRLLTAAIANAGKFADARFGDRTQASGGNISFIRSVTPPSPMNEMNPVNEMNEMNPVNEMNEMNPVNEMNEMNPVNEMNEMND